MTSPSLHKPPEPGLAERLRFRNWRIANKLLVVTLLLSLVPLLIISWISAEIRAQAVTSDTRINLSRLSHDVALRVSQAIVLHVLLFPALVSVIRFYLVSRQKKTTL